jgi:hypothetical protein
MAFSGQKRQRDGSIAATHVEHASEIALLQKLRNRLCTNTDIVSTSVQIIMSLIEKVLDPLHSLDFVILGMTNGAIHVCLFS